MSNDSYLRLKRKPKKVPNLPDFCRCHPTWTRPHYRGAGQALMLGERRLRCRATAVGVVPTWCCVSVDLLRSAVDAPRLFSEALLMWLQNGREDLIKTFNIDEFA